MSLCPGNISGYLGEERIRCRAGSCHYDLAVSQGTWEKGWIRARHAIITGSWALSQGTWG